MGIEIFLYEVDFGATEGYLILRIPSGLERKSRCFLMLDVKGKRKETREGKPVLFVHN